MKKGRTLNSKPTVNSEPQPQLQRELDLNEYETNQESVELLQEVDLNEYDTLAILIDHESMADVVSYVKTLVQNSSDNQKAFEKINISVEEAINISKKTQDQNNSFWLNERKKRITASISYELFTFFNNKVRTESDWDKKLSNVFCSKFKGNEATRYGLESECEAKKIYEDYYKFLMFNVGLLVSKNLPFLAASPDSISYDGDEFRLIEIKSPLKGRDCDDEMLLSSLMFLKREGKGWRLKNNHKYYGQVQLSLAVSNLNTCDFIIYSSFSNSIYVIQVEKNVEFLKSYIPTLTKVYFEKIIKFQSKM